MKEQTQSQGPARAAAIFVILFILVISGLTLDGLFPDDGPVGEADGIRNVEGYIRMKESGSNQKGNLIKLYTGPGESRFTDQILGEVEIYRTAKVLRDRVMVSLYLEFDDPTLVRGSVSPMVYVAQPGNKFDRQPISVSLSLASPMLRYSEAMTRPIRVKVWGEWMAQWSPGSGNSWESGMIEPYYIYVQVVPYHYLQMSFSPAMLNMGPGGTGEIDVIVLNTANTMERVDLTIPNEQVYAKEGWMFEFNRTTLDIAPDSRASARIRVTAPRKSIRWNMDTQDFTVKATSYYDSFEASAEGRETHTYEMTFMVYIFGLDFVYIPWAWALLLYAILFIVLLNAGIWPFTMRRRDLPPGKEPGFKALKRYARDPERRARVKANREEKRRIRKAEKERRKQLKEKEKENRKASPPRKRERGRSVADLRRSDDELDFELPGLSRDEKKPSSGDGSDDFDIRIEEPKKPQKRRKKSFLRRSSKGSKRSEDEIRDIEL